MRLTIGLKYIIAVTIVLLIFMGVTLWLVSYRHNELVIEQTRIQAKALFQQIVITRRWVADHGGVFVEKLPWVEPNPYLKDSLVEGSGGRRFVKENPAMVTKQLSRYAQKEKLYSFHITSLKLMNPENAPDEFEKSALLAFEEKKTGEASSIEKIGGATFFRYIAPLYVEQACLECHHDQGYKVGDVRGAISITVPMDYALSVIASDRRYMTAGALVTVTALIAVLFLVTRGMVILPINMIRSHMLDFSRNGKTDIPVLKTRDEIEDLSRSFVEMAVRLDEYHSCLQGKIAAATSELVEKNAALQEMNRSKSDFLAKISHELRTPLTAIRGAIDYISARVSMKNDDSEINSFLDVIRKNSERLIRLVNNLLDYERIELGEFVTRFDYVDMRNLLEEVVMGFRSEAEKKGVSINLDAEDVIVSADGDRIRQVAINLISNALNFSPDSSVIKVSLKDEGKTAIVRVEDSGRGVADEEKEKIFTQFYSKGVKNGTGLGLAICKGIVDAHHGEIGVAHSDKGGSFYFRIPKRQEVSVEREKESACNR